MESCLSLSNGRSSRLAAKRENDPYRPAARVVTSVTKDAKDFKLKLGAPNQVNCRPNSNAGGYWSGTILCKTSGENVQKSRSERWRPSIRPPHVTTCPIPQTIQSTGEDVDWRLDEELLELKVLQRKLLKTKTTKEKVMELDSNWRVRSAFERSESFFLNPVVEVAVDTLNDYEIFLLKCLVAIGQEHVLKVQHLWSLSGGFDEFNSRVISSQDILQSNVCFHVAKSADHQVLQDSQFATLSVRGSTFQTKRSFHEYKAIAETGRLRIINLLKKLVKTLEQLENFYDCIGGIVGYQVNALELIKASEEEHCDHRSNKTLSGGRLVDHHFYVPNGPNLFQETHFATQAAGWGIECLPSMAEIYPLGGAGDRLGLVDDSTGEALPVAMLPYCGRTLLEGLIRDLQAREFLYFKIFNKQIIVPVAIMTSASKNNNVRVKNLCKSRDWFGRGSENFQLFEQPLVPTIAADDGHWLVSEPLVLVLKPGGHGVIWKLINDKGIFGWFYAKGCSAGIVRQISNPVAATDTTLLALSGIGLHHNKKFGFASCERNVGTAEGVNVLVESRTHDGVWKYGVTCVEYTEFTKMGIADVPISPGSIQAKFPANTNVLFVDLKAVEQIASSRSSQSLPGMILNLKKPVEYIDYLGVKHSVRAGRLECTMQNIADSLLNQSASKIPVPDYEKLDTFIVYNNRRKVTSSAKRQRRSTDSSLHQTPDGSFLDISRNAFDLLTSCNVKMPQMEENHCYIDSAPPFLIFLHPSLGPIWEIVRQKIRGGSLAEGSELQLEIAEFAWDHVELHGSLVIQADNVMGSVKNTGNEETRLHYGIKCGRCQMQRVRVFNRGVNWNCPTNVYWQNKVERFETLKIHLRGNAEFYAHDVTFQGPYTFEVPEGHRLQVTSSGSGILCRMDPLPPEVVSTGSWFWRYEMLDDGHVKLKFVDCL